MEEKFRNLPLRSGVGIVVLNKENKVFVAKRIDNPKNFWQMPQGGVDGNEDFLSAALRELKEETGYVGKKVLEIGRVESNPAIMSNHTYTYLALDCEKISDQSLDGTEDIEIVKKNIDEIPQLINEKEIEHALVISAFYFYNLYLMNKKHG